MEFTELERDLLHEALKAFLNFGGSTDGYNGERVALLEKLNAPETLENDVHEILVKLGTVEPRKPEDNPDYWIDD